MTTIHRDGNLDLLDGKVAVIGYGSQGHAHALNLRDSGVDVEVGLRPGSASRDAAEDAGLQVATIAEATRGSQVVAILLPDHVQKGVYEQDVAPNLGERATLLFAHGFNVHFGRITPAPGNDVVMVAPKAPGHRVRELYEAGAGTPGLVAVHQDASGNALDLALAYGTAIGCGRVGMLETTFAEETESDLFGEQAVLCGGVTQLMQAGFETLVEAGYQPELAYFECFHELPLVVDLMHSEGIAGFRYMTSETCAFGDVTRGPRVINDAVRVELKKVLAEIQSGAFAEEWLAEKRSGGARFDQLRGAAKDHPLERTRAQLQKLLPSLSENGQHLDAVEAATQATSDARA